MPTIEHVVLILVALPALFLVTIAMEEIVVRYVPSLSRLGLGGIEDFLKMTRSWPWVSAVLLIGVGPAIGEELWCRGFLGQGLSGRYGSLGGALLASFFFGLIHIEPPQAIMACLLGMVLHLCYLATRSILVPMLMHFANNSLAILAISETGRFPIMETLEDAYHNRPLFGLFCSFFVLGVAATALYRSRARIWTPDGMEAPAVLYPHVEIPSKISVNQVIPGSVSVLEVCSLIVAACLFAAMWFGL